MLLDLFYKEGRKTGIEEQEQALLSAIKEVEEGNCEYLPSAFCAFGLKDPALVRSAGSVLGKLMKTLSMAKLIRLSESFREHTSLDWFLDWENLDLEREKAWFDTEEDYMYALVLGTFHPNGYFRERCLYELEPYPDSLPFFILRMNDWVLEIRRAAACLAEKRAENCPLTELFLASQALYKVQYSGRRESEPLETLEILIKERLKKEKEQLQLFSVLRYEFSVRKSLYLFLFSEKILDKSQADFLLSREKAGFCQLIIITGILKDYGCSMEEVDEYLEHKNFCVRRRAMEYKYKLRKDSWPGLTEKLMDKNRGIRELAAFILRNHTSIHIPDFYREQLRKKVTVTAILGIGETGSKELTELVKSYLKHEDEAVVRAALVSYGKLAGSEGENLYWNYLFDSRFSISKTAYRCIEACKIRYGSGSIYDAVMQCESPWLKKHLALLLLQEDSWKRIPYLIRLYEDPALEDIQFSLYLAMQHRNVYSVLTREEGERLEQVLKDHEDHLPGEVVNGIRFDLKYVVKP